MLTVTITILSNPWQCTLLVGTLNTGFNFATDGLFHSAMGDSPDLFDMIDSAVMGFGFAAMSCWLMAPATLWASGGAIVAALEVNAKLAAAGTMAGGLITATTAGEAGIVQWVAMASKKATGGGGEESCLNKNTTRTGVIRNNPRDWRRLRDLWDRVGLDDILSPMNRREIAAGRTPRVDDNWIRWFPGDAHLRVQRIPMHHINGPPLTIPLPA